MPSTLTVPRVISVTAAVVAADGFGGASVLVHPAARKARLTTKAKDLRCILIFPSH
jgi:hypothetical protein